MLELSDWTREAAEDRQRQHTHAIVADELTQTGWSLGWVSVLDLKGRTIWIVDAHGYGKRFIVRAREKLTAFAELESTVPQHDWLHGRRNPT